MFLITILCIWSAMANFEVQMPPSKDDDLSTKIRIAGKEVIVDLNLASQTFAICCKPNGSIFHIVYNFLSNPFFQINQYSCPKQTVSEETGEVVIPILGVIKMQYDLNEYPDCDRGLLGLSKQSNFVSYLPVNTHTIKVQIQNYSDSKHKQIKVSFGKLDSFSSNIEIFESVHRSLWDLTASSIRLGEFLLQTRPKIVFATDSKGIQVPQSIFDKLMAYYPSNQTCTLKGKDLLCLCEKGIPLSFPQFNIQLRPGSKISFPARTYMKIDSNICKLKLNPSPDEYWHFDLTLLEDTILYFDLKNSQIGIQRHQSPSNPSSDLIHLPIQLILNCCVILLLCVFASMVIIELVKRLSGLSDARDENIREYVLRRNME